MKAKSTISAELFFRETFSGYSIEIGNSVYFLRRHNRYWRSNYLIGENFIVQKFFVTFLWRNFLPLREKGNIWKKVTSITKPRDFSRIFIIYKISYDRVL